MESKLTKVRVRGKTRPVEKIEPRMQSAKFRRTQASPRSRLSGIERLPTEILQHIFVLSFNVFLPTVSKTLLKQLASEHLKRQLLLQAFSHVRYYEDPKSANDWVNSVAEAQSVLLRQKWCTYSLFKKCQKFYISSNALRELREFLKDDSDESRATAVVSLQRYLDLHYTIGGLMVLRLNEEHENLSSYFFVWKRNDCQEFHVELDCRRGGEFRMLHVELFGCNPRSMTPPLRRRSYIFPACARQCQLPEKLLHGPWTKERGEFLKLLLDAHASIDWVNSTAGEVALKGLEDAIREGNKCVIKALIIACPRRENADPRSVDAHSRDDENENGALQGYYRQDTPYTEAIEAQIDENYEYNPDTFKAPEGSWQWPSGKLWSQIVPVGVRPTYKHYQIAITQSVVQPDIISLISGSMDQRDMKLQRERLH